MESEPRTLVFIGIRGTVIALGERDGSEVWRTPLRSAEFITILWDGATLVAANSGELWRLDPRTGQVLWRNELKGMGRGLVSLASSRLPATTSGDAAVAEQGRRDAQAATDG